MNMPDVLENFLIEMGFALLEYRGSGTFKPIARLPQWFNDLWGSSENSMALAEVCPFLENFLFEAEAFWEAPGAASCQSETWVEKTPGGREIPLQARALILAGKRVLAISSPDVEFHEQVKMLQTARNALLDHERLAREVQKKEILLHCIVHDLSQPLSVMHVAMDCLSEEAISDHSRQFLTLGKLASNQQEMMIRDILHTFSDDLRASLNAGTEESASADLLECARKTAQALAPTFEAKRVRLTVTSADPVTKWFVRAEESRLQRIFSNLLENALRYSPPVSQVTVGVKSESDCLKAYVDDEGPGLPKDLRPEQIFGLFMRGKQGGGKAGLGLYFCRITVERWGGSIGCVSLPGKGSSFWFRLPRALSGAINPPQPSATSAGQATSGTVVAAVCSLRILFADDQPEIRTLTCHQLKRAGHTVVVAKSGTEALRKIRSGVYDVILLDHEMPGMTGDEVAAAVRKSEAGKKARAFLIASTGNTSPEDVLHLQQAGFDSVLSKPFQLEDLYRVLPASPSTLNDPALSKSVRPAQASFNDLLARIGGDAKLLGRMIRTFLLDTPKRMSAIATALRRRDAEALASLAHALKGSVSLFGAEPARKLAQDLQEIGRAGDLSPARAVFDSLQEEIANLLENLRGYAKQSPARPRSVTTARPKPSRKRGKRRR